MCNRLGTHHSKTLEPRRPLRAEEGRPVVAGTSSSPCMLGWRAFQTRPWKRIEGRKRASVASGVHPRMRANAGKIVGTHWRHIIAVTSQVKAVPRHLSSLRRCTKRRQAARQTSDSSRTRKEAQAPIKPGKQSGHLMHHCAGKCAGSYSRPGQERNASRPHRQS